MNDQIRIKIGEVWGEKIKDFEEEFNQMLEQLKDNVHLDIPVMEQELMIKSLLGHLTKGGIAGGAAAIGLSFYAAVLGPAASSVTVVGALSVVALPVVVAALAGGVGVWLWNKYNGKLDPEVKEMYLKLIEDLRESIGQEIIVSRMFPKVEAFNNDISQALINDFDRGILKSCKIENIDTEIDQINEILKKCDVKCVA